MARQVHLVGSVGLRDAETVFTTVSVMLGSCCPRIPDGETGERGYWMRWQRNTFALNLGFEEVMTTRSLPGFNDNVARTFFTLRKDTDPERIELGELGYARAATDSYRIFTRLIDEGKVAADVRFQVSLPTPTADELAHKCRPRFGHSRGPGILQRSQIFCTYTKRCVANEEPRQRSVCSPHAPRKTPMELP